MLLAKQVKSPGKNGKAPPRSSPCSLPCIINLFSFVLLSGNVCLQSPLFCCTTVMLLAHR